MAKFWDNNVQKAKDLWGKSTLAQKILLGGILATVLVAMIILLLWLNKPNYGVLFSNLNNKDASRVVEVLKKQNVDYKLQNQGSTILVPKNKIYDLRLQMAGENVLHGQGVGFELFSKNQIGQTDFVQKVNYQRALQAELARTISELPQVRSARIHLVLPEKSLFIEEQNPATASVLLNLEPGSNLNKQQVQGVVNLVQTAVEGLSKENITVADTAGNLLYQPSEENSLQGLTESQLSYKSKLEKMLQNRIERMLTPVIGAGRVIARVNAELDFSQKTITKEIYDPDSLVVRSEQKTTETSRGTSNMQTSAPEPAYRQENAAGSGTTQESSRTQKTTNFEINKEERHEVVPQGELDRLSAAVLIDGLYEQNKQGESVFVPRKEEEINQIKQLVKGAMGFSSSRGDSIEVASMPFGKPEAIPEASLWDKIANIFQKIWKPLLNALIIILFLFFVVRPLVLALLKPRVTAEETESAEGLPKGESRTALTELSREEQLARESKKNLDELKNQSAEIIEKNKEDAVGILRQWLQQE